VIARRRGAGKGQSPISLTGFDPEPTFIVSDRMARFDVNRSLRIAAVDVAVGKAAGRDGRQLDLSYSGLDRVGSLGLT
jgi:hypothetical protein